MKILISTLFVLALPLWSACSPQDSATNAPRTRIGKADLVGSCSDSCGDQSESGSCWCDAKCSELGDCCVDIADQCQIDECSFDSNANPGCADGEVCNAGICKAFCPPGTEGNCCAPNVCVADPDLEPLTCSDVGGECKSSPSFPTFSADCLKDFNMGTGEGTCSSANQTCCVPNDCPDLVPPGPDFCAPDQNTATIVENDCIVGWECLDMPPIPETPTCEGHCGGPAASNSCWCDDKCESFGDCCDDIAEACQ